MTKIFGSLFVIFALAFSAFGQEQGKTEKTGMFWYYFRGAQQCSAEWDQAVAARKDNFAYLAKKVQEGDVNKIRRAMTEAQYSKPDMGIAWACGFDYSGNLSQWAGRALAPGNEMAGVATEAEYDEAMKLVKTLRAKIVNRPLTTEQKKLWAEAVKVIGADPESSFYKFNE